MTIYQPEPDNTSVIEPKVKLPAVAIYIAGVILLATADAFTANDNELLFAVLPDTVESFILPLVLVAVQLITGYFARHQWRTSEIIR